MTTNYSRIAKAFKHPAQDEENVLQTDKILREVTSVVALMNAAGKSPGRVAKAVSLFSVSLSLATITKTIYDFIKKANSEGEFTVKVSEQDLLFRIAEKWLMDALPDEKKVSVFATSQSADGMEVSVNGPKPVKVHTSYDGSIEHEITIGGYIVKVSTNKPEAEAAANDSGRKMKFVDRTIIFSCPSAASRDAVLSELRKQAQALRHLQPGFFNSRWGGFDRVSDVPDRSMESVILKEGQMERIMTHLTRFRENEKTYKSIGVPFRTGIMFYGPPGSGKSSTAAVIANELHMNLYYISLKGMDDETLINCTSRIPADSLVILEDIDSCRGMKDRETADSDKEDSVSISAILNVLDGLQSPPGVVFMLTTNRIEVLDPAILRPGRVDLMEELGYLNDYQLRGMVEYYTGSVPDTLPHITEEDQISSAEIVGIVRGHIPHIENSAQDIVDFVGEKVLTGQTS